MALATMTKERPTNIPRVGGVCRTSNAVGPAAEPHHDKVGKDRAGSHTVAYRWVGVGHKDKQHGQAFGRKELPAHLFAVLGSTSQEPGKRLEQCLQTHAWA